MKKKLLCMLLVLCMLAGIIPHAVWAAEEDVSIIARGSCGQAARWVLDSTGTMTISGKGEINSMYGSMNSP